MTLERRSVFEKIFRMQVAVGLFGFVCLAALSQVVYAVSLFYGVAVMAGNAWWLARRLEKTDGLDVQAGQRSLYAGAALRFVALIAVLLAAHLIGLHLLAVAAGMFVAQAVVFITAMNEFKKEGKGEGLG
ncbi:MAG: hypothetical protein CO187_01550 [Zetaproteobacteria bacterium CG_4_9_14_3_um_filter_53_7]|nr:MAG: hypothetical protein CO187_01550 [Zetaproteobacteria bacterium CG_4_9_14_3_um_filter_53_7]